MKDIFDAKIICKNCNTEMNPLLFDKQGFRLRAMQCPECKEKIFHPVDVEKYNQYNNLKQKTYNVKLRIVGNSHAVSIPKEIVDFINETHSGVHKEINDIVKLCFEDFGKLSLKFYEEDK